MANVDAPFGLRPIRHAHGAPYNGAGRWMYVPSTYAVNLFIGDPLTLVAAGSNTSEVTAPGAGNFPAGTLPSVEINVATNPICGVAMGFAYTNNSDLSRQYGAASTERLVFVADDPDLIFAVQEVSGGTALTAADVGLNAVIVSGTGSTATGISGWELNNSGEATTAGLEVKIIGLHNVENNAVGEHAVWEVKINDHTLAHAAAGI